MERYSYHALYETRGCGFLLSRLSNMSIPHLSTLYYPPLYIKGAGALLSKQLYSLLLFVGASPREKRLISSFAYRARSKPEDADKQGTLQAPSSK